MGSWHWRSLAWGGVVVGLVACRSASIEPSQEATPPAWAGQLESRIAALEQENERLAGQMEDLAALFFELGGSGRADHRPPGEATLSMATLEAFRADEMRAMLPRVVLESARMGELPAARPARARAASEDDDGFPSLLATLPADEFWDAADHVELLRAVYRRAPAAALDVLNALQGTPEDLEEFAQALCETGLSSRVRFETDEPGALVHWSFLGRDEDLEAEAPTNESEVELCIGFYRFWTVRGGERTSEEKQLPVIDEEVTVVLEEDDF